MTVETEEEVLIVDIDVNADVDEASTAVKLIDTPALCNVSVSRSKAMLWVSVDTSRKYQ